MRSQFHTHYVSNQFMISHAVTELDKQSNGSAVGLFSASWSVSQKIGESAIQTAYQ
jgi:hypothetical protein